MNQRSRIRPAQISPIGGSHHQTDPKSPIPSPQPPKKGDTPTVSLIATVYNEGESLRRLLDSVAAQRRQPDEVVICDGGSQDDTVAILESYRGRLPNLRILVEPGANISRGRNLAIAAARGPVIAATDAGVRLDPGWLEALIEPFDEAERMGKPIHAVAGFFVPDPANTFETAMAATVLPLVDEIAPARFLPSSRSVAFTKAAWQAAGGYPEWLDYCEDLLFDFAVNALTPEQPSAFAWAPDARVYFQPRSSLRSFWTQYYRYARGDGKADLWRKRHLIRYVTYGVALPALLGHAFWGFFARWLGWVGLILGVIVYCARPWLRLRRIGRDLSLAAWWTAAALIPVIRVVGDVAKMVGYPVGIVWREKNVEKE
ncbi:MAG: glycosyltransferase [Caldilineaceae bacterium]